jgi:transposase-like protein
MTNKLSEEEWQEIKELLKKKDRNINKIAQDYSISRHSIYVYAWKRNWITKEVKEEPKGLLSRFKSFFSPKNLYKSPTIND